MKTVIEGVTYEMRPMDPMLVLEHGSKLVSELAAPAIEKFGTVALAEATKDSMKAAGVAVIAEALKRLSLPSVQAATQALFSTATQNNVELDKTWRVHFLGKPKSLIAFLVWGMEAQFGDFFVGLGEQIASGMNGRLVKLVSPTEPSA